MALGWGTTYYDGHEVDILRGVPILVWTNEDCDQAYFQPITEVFMCAGYADGGRDACQGDSGGPLISPRPNNLKRKNDFHERMELVGVVSFGQKCGTPNPGGYTRTNRFIKWIIDSMTKVTDTAVVCNGFFGNWIG